MREGWVGGLTTATLHGNILGAVRIVQYKQACKANAIFIRAHDEYKKRPANVA
jgi:hypothetical protein